MDVKDLELLRKIINQLYSLEDRTQEDVDSFYRSTNYNSIPNLIEYNYEYPDESHRFPNGVISDYVYEF